jgi:hypothetical protein
MIEATVKRVDVAGRTLVIQTADGKEVSLMLRDGTPIEVIEPATTGRIPGSLEDIHEGYLVEVEFAEGASPCVCHSLISIS